MKRNVDLTEDRDFRSDKWDMIIPDMFFESTKQTGMIMTGKADERASKKLFNHLEEGKICEMCGREIRWFASEEMTLCSDCLASLEVEFLNKNWIFK